MAELANVIPSPPGLAPAGRRPNAGRQPLLLRKKMAHPEEEHPEEDEEAAEEKGLYYVPWGVTSFADLDAAEVAYESNEKVYDLSWQFRSLVDNIMGSDLVEDKAAALVALSGEFSARVKSTLGQKAAEKAAEEPSTDFMVWKDATSGLYRFAGTYSSKFIDDSRPPDILSSASHADFVGRVHKGLAPWPDLYVWHIKAAVGKVDWLAYDDAGFPICVGYFYPQYNYVAESLAKCEEPLGMSHGMPLHTIVRDSADPQVIVKYDSREVSVLLRKFAANKWTGFMIQKGENPMAVMDEVQRAGLVRMLGPDAAAQFEQDLTGLGKSLEEANVLNKAQEETPAPAQADAEVTEPETPAAAAEPETPAAEPVAEDKSAPAAVEATPQTPPADVVTKDVLVETVQLVVGPIMQALGGQAEMIKNQNILLEAMTQKLAATEGRLAEIEKSDAEKVANTAANTPASSMAALILGQNAGLSAVGSREAQLNSNWNLAKDAPQVAPPAGTPGLIGPAGAMAGRTGIPLLDNLLLEQQQGRQG